MTDRAESPRQWRRQLVDEVKADIKAALDREGEHGPDARLRFAMAQIRLLQENPAEESSLRCFVFIVSALYHHSRFGGLSSQDVRGLTDLAQALLLLQGVRPGYSKLAYLHGELHMALSQINRAKGFHWRSAWQLQMAARMSKPALILEDWQYKFAVATRMARLSQADVAMIMFEEAENSGASGRQKLILRLNRIKLLRLTRSFAAAQGLIAEARHWQESSESEALDLLWEDRLVETAMAGDPTPLLSMLGRGKAHQIPAYQVEAWLYSRCHQSQDYIERLSLMRTIKKKNASAAKILGYTLDAALVIESCYDTDIPYRTRLLELGKILERTEEAISIDKEVLILGAAIRWLVRTNAFDFALLTWLRYRQISLSLTGGGHQDVLGFLGDLQDKDWTPAPEASADEDAA